MAQIFDGPVTIKGGLLVQDNNGSTLYDFTGVTGKFLNIVAAGTIVAQSGFHNVFCESLTPTAVDKVMHLAGGLVTSGGFVAGADLVVQGTGHFEHNIEVKGDIHFTNAADCAEDFTVDSAIDVEPGTVVILGPNGLLFPSEKPYDKRVIGVVSGAGNFRPGIVLDRKSTNENRQPAALVGKVYCYVDADHGAIEVGDLLTTSATCGCAMKASDPLKAFGAVLGKALSPHNKGRGLIPMLVALQ